MISPPSHAGGGNTGTTAEGGGGPRPASPAHLDQNSNKSGPLSRPAAQQQTLSGAADVARHYLSSSPSPSHQRSLDLLPAASASSSAFLPPPGAEFRPPWLPEQRTAVGPWLPPPPSALLLHSLQLGFAGASSQPSSRGGGGLLLPSAVDFSRLGGGIFSPLGLHAAAAAAGYFPPPPMLEQRYHRPAVPASAAVSTYSPSSSSSSPLPTHFPPGPPLTSLPPNDTIPTTTAKRGGHKRKWDESSLKEEEEEERRRVALLSSAASIAPPVGDARPLKSRLLARSSPDVLCPRAATPPTQQPPAAYAVVGSSSLAAAPIMSVRPAERYSSSSSGALARPGHPAHFTQVQGTDQLLLSVAFLPAIHEAAQCPFLVLAILTR
jgi:hypothetical protein